MADDAVTDKRGILESVLGGCTDPRLLNIRLFDKRTIKTVYERQTVDAKAKGLSNCPYCAMTDGANHSRIYKLTEMDADHVTAWSRSGSTSIDNCQMLCKTHNRAKGEQIEGAIAIFLKNSCANLELLKRLLLNLQADKDYKQKLCEMTKLEEYKEKFSKDYSKAIKEFNDGEFQSAQRDLRPGIEKLCKLVMYDMANDEGEVDSLIDGSQWLKLSSNTEKYVLFPGNGVSKEGSSLADTAKKYIYYRRPQLLGSDKPMNRIKTQVDSDFGTLVGIYGTSSELAQHDDGSSSLDLDTQSVGILNYMPKIFDDLKKVLSEGTYIFLNNLEKPKQQIIKQNDDAIRSEEENNAIVLLDQLTNHFERTSGTQYVALLPESNLNKYGKKIKKSQLQDFFRLQWCFVVDLNPKTDDGLFMSAPTSKQSTLRIITNNLSEVTGTSTMTNWLFAKGRQDLEVFDKKKVFRDTPNLFKNTFSKIVRTGKTDDYIIFDFCSGTPKYTTRLLDKLGDVFNSWDSVEKRCKILSFSNDSSYIEELKGWAEDYDLSCLEFISVGFQDFLYHVVEELPTESSKQSTHLLVHGKSLDLTDDVERYAAVGIEFIGSSPTVNETREWDFYSGAEITWEELDQHLDVQRDIYPIIRQRIVDLIKTSRKVEIFTIRHKPGSGATTISRRLAYDIRMEDASGNLQCTVIEIRSCSNIRLMEEYLAQLSETVENTCVLAIVDAKRVGREKFDWITKKMSDSGKRIIFVYLETYTRKPFGQKENLVYLDDRLSSDEIKRFTFKYLKLGLDEKMLTKARQGNHHLEVIDFPLMLKDNETSSNLSSYVKEWMETLPDNLIIFCAYVGFVSRYSESGVNQNLLKDLWYDSNHPLLSYYSLEIRTSLGKLLIEEYTKDGRKTGIWRPRYRRFSTFLLDSYRTNWMAGLSDIAKSFIALCSNAGQLGDDDKDMLYNIFITRRNADYRALEDRRSDIRNKFSLLIKDLNDMERSESLFNVLVEAFPDNAVFQGHFARFLYEKTTSINNIDINDRLFNDAQERLNIAFDLNPNDSDLFHMQGMLLRRRIAALQKMFDRESTDPDNIDIGEYEETLEDWVEKAKVAFETSITLSPASPYGYAAECQLFKEAIVFGSKMFKSNDYSFCETNPVYVEYTDKLGETLDMFEQICYTFRDEGLSQIWNSYPIYESVRLFHANIVGRDKESINRYRSMYSNANGDKKMLYGSLLVKSIVYSKIKKTKDSRLAYSYLGNAERKEIEKVLEYQKNQGDVKSFETLFLLKLYGPDEFTLDEAIDLLKDWESQYTEGNLYGWGYLNACFYLAVCYASKAIIGDVRNTELTSLAKDYFIKSEDIAKKFDKGTIRPLCFFGGKTDIHCIVDKNHRDSDAIPVVGVITRIQNNSGEIELKCGLTASFNPRGYEILKDEGTPLKGILGFSYSGPGLYDFARGDLRDSINVEDFSEGEPSFEELEKEFAPVEDLVSEKKDDTNTQKDIKVEADDGGNTYRTMSEQGNKSPIVLGKIDLPASNASRFVSKESVKEGSIRNGIFHEGKYHSKDYIEDRGIPHPIEVREVIDGETLTEGDEIIYELKSEPHKTKPKKKYLFAIKVRLKE